MGHAISFPCICWIIARLIISEYFHQDLEDTLDFIHTGSIAALCTYHCMVAIFESDSSILQDENEERYYSLIEHFTKATEYAVMNLAYVWSHPTNKRRCDSVSDFNNLGTLVAILLLALFALIMFVIHLCSPFATDKCATAKEEQKRLSCDGKR